MAQQALDHRQSHTILHQVTGKAVSQRVNAVGAITRYPSFLTGPEVDVLRSLQRTGTRSHIRSRYATPASSHRPGWR